MIVKPIATAALLTAGLMAVAAPTCASAETSGAKFGQRVASVTFGPYMRVELGTAKNALSNAYWLPPGASDPQVNFNPIPNHRQRGFGAVAFGYDWQNGFRADVSVFSSGSIGLTAPCSGASDGSACATHADITAASVQSSGLMGNLFYAPIEARGSNAIFQPFVVAGLGLARNKVGDWTRTKNPGNPTFAADTTRTFAGNASVDLAWSLGVGASLQLTQPGKWPVILEAAYRYYDFGSASGGIDPVGSGSSARQGLTLRHTDQVVSLGIRIPLKRY